MAESDTIEPTSSRERERRLADVCAGTAAVFRARSGREPVRCHARWSAPDAILVLVEDGLSAAERALVLGRHPPDSSGFRAVGEPTLAAVVEAATRRSVTAVRTTLLPSQDLTALVFALGGPAGPPQPRVIGDALSAERRARESVAQARRLVAEASRVRRVNLAHRAAATATLARLPRREPS